MQDLDLSLDEQALRNSESLISDRFSIDGRGSSPIRTHFVLSLDEPTGGACRTGLGLHAEPQWRLQESECRAAAAEKELERVRGELRAALERVDELEAANQLLTGQLQEKEVLHLLRHRWFKGLWWRPRVLLSRCWTKLTKETRVAST